MTSRDVKAKARKVYSGHIVYCRLPLPWTRHVYKMTLFRFFFITRFSTNMSATYEKMFLPTFYGPFQRPTMKKQLNDRHHIFSSSVSSIIVPEYMYPSETAVH